MGEDSGPDTILVETQLYHLDGEVVDFQELELPRNLQVEQLREEVRIALDIPHDVKFRLGYYPSAAHINCLDDEYYDFGSQPNLDHVIASSADALHVDIDIHEDDAGVVEWLIRRADWIKISICPLGLPKHFSYTTVLKAISEALNLPVDEPIGDQMGEIVRNELELKWRHPCWDARPAGTICLEEQEGLMDIFGLGEMDFDLIVDVGRRCQSVGRKRDPELLKRLLREKFGFVADADDERL